MLRRMMGTQTFHVHLDWLSERGARTFSLMSLSTSALQREKELYREISAADKKAILIVLNQSFKRSVYCLWFLYTYVLCTCHILQHSVFCGSGTKPFRSQRERKQRPPCQDCQSAYSSPPHCRFSAGCCLKFDLQGFFSVQASVSDKTEILPK